MSPTLGLFLVRLVFGTSVAAHGAQQLFGAFGGQGLAGTGAYFEGLGLRPGRRFAILSGLAQCAGGLLLTLGLFTPLAAASVIGAMLVAIFTVHIGNGFFALNNGIELPFLYASAALSIAIAGAGSFSLDALLGLDVFDQIAVIAVCLAIAVASAGVTLALRQPPSATRQPVEAPAREEEERKAA